MLYAERSPMDYSEHKCSPNMIFISIFNFFHENFSIAKQGSNGLPSSLSRKKLPLGSFHPLMPVLHHSFTAHSAHLSLQLALDVNDLVLNHARRYANVYDRAFLLA